MTYHQLPKVLILEPSGLMFGSERALLDLLPPLRGKWDVTVCCPPGLFAEAAAGAGVAVWERFTPYLHQKGRLARLRAAFSFRRIVRELHPDLIHVNQAGAARIAAFAAGSRIPLVIHSRLFDDHEYLRERGLEKRACAIIYVSEAMKTEASKSLCTPNLFRLYDSYAPTCDGQSTHTLGRPLLCIGRLGKVKGQDLILGALAELKRRGVRADVSFLGSAERDSRYGDELKEMARRLGIESRVRWLGFRENVFFDLRDTAALLAPSEKEPLGRVIFEAWDAGTVPVVWRGSGGAAEVVEASGGGIMFQERTPASLADAMQDVLEMPVETRTSLVKGGRTWLAANCQSAIIAAQLSAIWDGCIK